jgi:hypothetical protein
MFFHWNLKLKGITGSLGIYILKFFLLEEDFCFIPKEIHKYFENDETNWFNKVIEKTINELIDKYNKTMDSNW